MTHHDTSFCHTLDCTEEEAARLVVAFGVTGDEPDLPASLADAFPSSDPDDPFAGIAAFYEDSDVLQIGATIQRVQGGVVITAEDEPDVVAIAEFIRVLAPSSLPTGFTWSDAVTSRDGGGHGGGYVLITREGYQLHSAAALLEDALEAARG